MRSSGRRVFPVRSDEELELGMEETSRRYAWMKAGILESEVSYDGWEDSIGD